MTYEQLLAAIENELRATIDDMLDSPHDYFCLDGVEEVDGTALEDLDRGLIVQHIAAQFEEN